MRSLVLVARCGWKAGGGTVVMGEGKSKCRPVQSGCGERGEGSDSGSELVFTYVGDDAGERSSDWR